MRIFKHLIVVLALLPLASGLRGTTFTVQTLSFPGATQTYAQAINSSGIVAGYYTDTSGTSHGFLWSAGNFKRIDFPSTSGTWITGINDSDVVCGYTHVLNGSTGETVGFTLHSGAVVQFTATASSRGTFPGGINNSGIISGYNETGALSAGVYGGFLLTNATGGVTTPLDLPAEKNTWASGLNTNADVVGYAGTDLNATTPVDGFVYKSKTGQFSVLNMPGMVQTRLYGINDAGAIAGYGLDSSQITHSFLYKAGTFEAFTLPDFTVAIPQGIDENGIVVGYAITSTDAIVGFIATP